MKFSRSYAVLAMSIAVLAVGAMSGCSTVGRAQEYLGEAVTLYCAQPAEQRAGIRSAVNVKAAPNIVKIECAGDGATQTGSQVSNPLPTMTP